MTRIISGFAKGRRLTVPKSGTRPTADRVREALFSSVESELGGWGGIAVLDLFAGSGAVGLEAMSRGAASAVLVENDRRAAEVCRRNATIIAAGAQVVQSDVAAWIAAEHAIAFDLVFADPPYSLSDEVTDRIVEALVAHARLAPQALVIFERPRSAAPVSWPAGFKHVRNKRFGETEIQRAVWYGPASYGSANSLTTNSDEPR